MQRGIANVLERPRVKFLNEHAFGSFKNAGDWILKDVRYRIMSTQNPASTTEKQKQKRVKLEYKATLDYGVLKNLEDSTVASFLELVNKVILIDDKPFGEVTYTNGNDKESHIKLTSGKKEDFLRLIENYSTLT